MYTFRYSDENSPALCTAHTKCGVGERQAIAGTKFNDATCVPCSAETFNAVAEQNTCGACTSPCSATQKEVTECKPSTDRVCADLSACTGVQWSATGAFPCDKTHGTCAVGKGMTVAGTSTADIQCADCAGGAHSLTPTALNWALGHDTCEDAGMITVSSEAECESIANAMGIHRWIWMGAVDAGGIYGRPTACNYYGNRVTWYTNGGGTCAHTSTTGCVCTNPRPPSSFSDMDNRLACKVCKMCAVGHGLEAVCTASTDTTCKACDADTTYSDTLSYDACKDKSLCPIGSVRREEKRAERGTRCVVCCCVLLCAVVCCVVLHIIIHTLELY
jgi:hypothetical protein